MPIIVLFTILALPASIMGIALGDEFNHLWNSTPASPDDNRSGLGFAFAAGLVLGVASGWVYIYWKFSEDVDHTSSATKQLILGTATALSALSFCFLYGFAVGPANHGEGAWLDGWLVLVLIGFLPVILNINDLVSKLIAGNKNPASTRDDNVRRMR